MTKLNNPHRNIFPPLVFLLSTFERILLYAAKNPRKQVHRRAYSLALYRFSREAERGSLVAFKPLKRRLLRGLPSPMHTIPLCMYMHFSPSQKRKEPLGLTLGRRMLETSTARRAPDSRTPTVVGEQRSC